MALELVGGALLSSFLQVAFDRLASVEILDYFQAKRLDLKLLEKLNISLLSINSVIDDAEDKHFNNSHVSAWLDRVKDAVLDADDLLDEIHTKASKSKLKAEYQTTSSKVRNYFRSSLSYLDKKLQSRIKKILDNLEFLASKKDILGLKEGGSVGLGKKVSQRLPTTSLVAERDVYGRDDDKKVIVDLLLSDNMSGNNLTVISIIGMGGIGKTTLAQLAFDDSKMEDEFVFKAWVCVSEEFDVVRVTRMILKGLNLSTDDTMDFDMLQVMLKEKLSGKKFLLVLDDVWNEDHLKWEVLQTTFVYGARGSKILMTTRSKMAALTMQCAHLHQLKQLPEEDSWLLFAKYALRDADQTSSFEEIGKKIIKKCKGLPLALKTIASLLYTKLSYEEWNGILSSKMWDISDDECNIMPALRLSYQYLPSALKRCFSYCSLLPKDYEFDKDYLVELWMAESFLQFHQQNKSMKELGDMFFNDLLSRSFFQQSSGDGKLFVMHDLVNDFAKYVSRGFCLSFEDVKEAQDLSNIIRHFSYIRKSKEDSKEFEAIYKANKLRTFLKLLMHGGERHQQESMSSKMIHDLLSNFKHLRVLSLCYYTNNFEVPDSIGNLKHLRYLNLTGSGMKKLPDSTCLLYNLQTLKLRHCRYLEELPSDMQKLINLCHLDFRGTRVRKMPKGLEKLKNLEVLSSFYVGKCSDPSINELAELKLRGMLAIEDLHNVGDPKDAVTANLKNKIHLEGLSLVWGTNNDGSENERDVLEKLQPPANLKELSIQSFGGTRFPDWLGDNYLCNIVSLKLRDCKYCLFLPPLGILNSLKKLQIEGLEGIVVIGPEFYGNNSTVAPFVSLKVLEFERMDSWVEWDCQNASGAFPCLEELRIKDCPTLKNQLPKHLPSLLVLEILNCMQLVASLPYAPQICHLTVPDCENLQWESLPSTLKTLTIGGQFMERPFLEKAMHTISKTYLESLKVGDCPVAPLQVSNKPEEVQEITPQSYSGFPSTKYTIGSSLNEIEEIADETRMETETGGNRLPPNRVESEIPNIKHQTDQHSSLAKAGVPITTQQSDTPNTTAHVKAETSSEDFDDQLSSFETLKVSTISQLKLLSPKLHSLKIEGCESLEALPDDLLGGIPTLQELYLISCSSLRSVPYIASLTTLYIRNCRRLEFLPSLESRHKHPSLHHLFIGSSCDSLTNLPLDLFSELEILCIWDCPNLLSFYVAEESRSGLASLESLEISDCPRLKSFPDEGLYTPNLASIFLSNCKDLNKLPNSMNTLTSLKSLFLHRCPQIDSFPSGGLPSSLTLISIAYCDKLTPQEDWGLHKLESLNHFELEGGCMGMESFPLEKLLPRNINSLRISTLQSLKKLDYEGRFQDLNALHTLEIHRCAVLCSLPEQRLPSSLNYLCVQECSLLTPRLNPKTGKEWHKVAHIPHLQIDDQVLS